MKHRAPRGVRPSDIGRAPAYVAIVPLIAVFATAVSFLLDRPLPVFAIVALVAGLLMFVRPRFAVVAMTAFWAGSLTMELQTVRLGPFKLTLGDLCLMIGVAGLVWARFRQGRPARTLGPARFAVPIAFFFLALFFSLAVAVLAGDSLGESFHSGLNCAPLLAYFFMREVYAGRARTLLNDMVVMTGILSAVTLGAIFVGFEPLIGRSPNLIRTRGMEFEALRIDPPLLRLACITLLLATFAAVPYGGRIAKFRWPIVALILAVEGYSMTRTTWTPLLLGWLLLPLVTWGSKALRPFLRRAIALVVVLVIGLSVASTGALGPTAQAMAVRAVSVTDDNVTSDPSMQDRFVEDEMALAKIDQHPFVGLGFPRPYGAYQYEYDVEQDLTRYIPKLFIHNSLLGLWMWFGLPGLLALLVLIGYVARAAWHVRHMKYRDASAPMAVVMGLAVLGVSSLFQTNLIYRPAYFAVAVGLACLDVWIAERALPREEQIRDERGPRVRPHRVEASRRWGVSHLAGTSPTIVDRTRLVTHAPTEGMTR